MTMIFPMETTIFICSNKELEDFIQAITATITNHLKYSDDKETRERWNDFMCNGITSTKPITATVLARILEITDETKTSHMGHIVDVLFKELPILKHYWQLTKVNICSQVS